MRIGVLSDLHCELAPSRQRSWINRYEPLELERRLRDATDIGTDDTIAVRRRAFTLGEAPAINPIFAPEDERWQWRGDRWAK